MRPLGTLAARGLRLGARAAPGALPRPAAAVDAAPLRRRSAVRTAAARGTTAGPGNSSSNASTSSTLGGGAFGADAAGAQGLSPEELAERATAFVELLQESISVTLNTGPRGFIRALQGADAITSLLQEYLQKGTLDEPQVIVRKLFEKLGATYIKLGQFIASSPTIFPAEYVTEFQKCLDDTEPVPFATIEGIIKAELKDRSIDDVFSYVNPVPLASASIAQVHEATLRESGKDVVLKVLKPGVEDVLTADLNFIYLASRYLEFISPELSRTSLSGILEDIRNTMIEEVDFEKESRNIDDFSNFLDQAGLRAYATAPFVYKGFSSKRLLVMERLYGAALTDLDAIRRTTQADPEVTLINALNTWSASVIGCDTFHADVHAGNLLVLPDGRVGFIDFGIVGRISPVTWKAVEALFAAVATSDFETMARALATMGATSEEVDTSAFARDLEKLFLEVQQMDTELVVSAGDGFRSVDANVVVDDAQLNAIILELVGVSETHGIKFPREFGLLVKQMLYFDRYVRILAPELSVVDDPRVNLTRATEQYSRTSSAPPTALP